VSDAIEQTGSNISIYEANEIIKSLRLDITSGKNWYIALLEAIGKWTTVKEIVGDRTYEYLICGEAFDWLLLAERLCCEVDGLIPENDKIRLLFFGKAPVNLTNEEFQSLIGDRKYSQYLNFFYGITVEEALFLAKQDEVRKERIAKISPERCNYDEEVFNRIYGSGKIELLNFFRKSKGYPRTNSTNLSEMKEFTYWLFKYRLENCDRSKVASDTKKAMEYLQEQFVRSISK
jgi:hypothetical protein